MSVFERYLTLWVGLCIVGGIVLGKVAPGVATYLDGLAIYVHNAPVVSIPIAVCLFFMRGPEGVSRRGQVFTFSVFYVMMGAWHGHCV